MAKPKKTVQKKVIESILAERFRQDQKWGPRRNLTLAHWHTILSEEVGEVAEAVLDVGHGEIYGPTERTAALFAALKAELVQVAAVAIATLEDLESR